MIRLAITRPVAVTMAYLAIALLGIAAWRGIPLELLPDTDLPRLYVWASWPGASPETTEAFLTSPLEAAIQQVRGVKSVESTSEHQNGRGVASISVEFAADTDMEFARLDLSERLAALESELPRDATPPWIQPYVPPELRDQDRPFLRYTIAGPYTAEALRQIVEDDVAPELRRLDGVADIEIDGGRDRVIEIELHEARILALGLDPETVARRVRDLELAREAGLSYVAGRVRTVALRQSVASAADIAAAPVAGTGGTVVRVRDVGRVIDTYEDPQQLYRIDGQSAVSFTVHRANRTNAVRVADAVKARVAALEPALARGARVILDDDQSEAIRAQLGDIRFRALVSAGVVFLVLLAFLGTFRATAIVFATIAFSILITLNAVYFAGMSLNVLTLMGLATGLGLLVDNAIVVLENVWRRYRGGEAPALAAERGARDVVLPVLAATLTTVIVLAPFVYLQGEMRAYYVPLALVVGMALVASLLVAFTFIPALASRILPRAAAVPETVPVPTSPLEPPRRSPFPFPTARWYENLLRLTLGNPWKAIATATVILIATGYGFLTRVDRGVLWTPWWENESYIDIRISLPRGDELERTDELARHFEERLRGIHGIERFVTRVWPQAAGIRVTFADSVEVTDWPNAVKEQLTAYGNTFGGAEVRVYGYGPSFYGGGASPPSYAIEVRGYDYEQVRLIAEDLGRRLQRFSRIRDVDTNATGQWFQRDRATELVLSIDRARLARHELTVEELTRRVAAATRGGAASLPMRVGGEETSLAVKLAGARDTDAAQLLDVLVPAAGGREVRLGDVASIRERDVLSRIRRADQQYTRNVTYEFRGPPKLGNVIYDAVLASTSVPPGYEVRRAEQDWRWAEDEQQAIWAVLALAFGLVFMLTAALFESLRQPFCVLLTVPMALIGVFVTFTLTGASFTREAWIGVIMMGGIVVNAAILLVDHVNQLRRRDGLPLDAALVRGTLERARPILMTSATTVFGLLPLVLFGRSADANIWNALAYSLIGGLASSTVLVLTVTPALYLLLERRRARATVAEAPAAVTA